MRAGLRLGVEPHAPRRRLGLDALRAALVGDALLLVLPALRDQLLLAARQLDLVRQLVLGDGALLLDRERAPREGRLVGLLLDALARRHLRAPSPSPRSASPRPRAWPRSRSPGRQARRAAGRPRFARGSPRPPGEERAQRRRHQLSASSCAIWTTGRRSVERPLERPVRGSSEKSTRARAARAREPEGDDALDVHVLEVGAARRRGTAARGRRAGPPRRRCRAGRPEGQAGPVPTSRPFL